MRVKELAELLKSDGFTLDGTSMCSVYIMTYNPASNEQEAGRVAKFCQKHNLPLPKVNGGNITIETGEPDER
jgi:hypothetical protein